MESFSLELFPNSVTITTTKCKDYLQSWFVCLWELQLRKPGTGRQNRLHIQWLKLRSPGCWAHIPSTMPYRPFLSNNGNLKQAFRVFEYPLFHLILVIIWGSWDRHNSSNIQYNGSPGMVFTEKSKVKQTKNNPNQKPALVSDCGLDQGSVNCPKHCI